VTVLPARLKIFGQIHFLPAGSLIRHRVQVPVTEKVTVGDERIPTHGQRSHPQSRLNRWLFRLSTSGNCHQAQVAELQFNIKNARQFPAEENPGYAIVRKLDRTRHEALVPAGL